MFDEDEGLALSSAGRGMKSTVSGDSWPNSSINGTAGVLTFEDDDSQPRRATMRKNTDRQIDYVEFNVTDIPQTRDFYQKAFGWTFTDYGPEYCEFNDGRLKGGFTTLGSPRSAGGPLVVLYANDLPATVRRVEEAGGKIIRPIYDFPGGQRFHFADPDGYELAVYTEVGGEA